MSGHVAVRSGVLVGPRDVPDTLDDMTIGATDVARHIRQMVTPAPSASAILESFRAPTPETPELTHQAETPDESATGVISPSTTGESPDASRTAGPIHQPKAPHEMALQANQPATLDDRSRGNERYLSKMAQFETNHVEDVFLPTAQRSLLVSVYERLSRVQAVAGHGNFNVISFDETLRCARDYSSVEPFPPSELAFLDALFADNARRYGFFGEKVTSRITASISERDRRKIPYTGHFLFRGDAVARYLKIKRDLGDRIILTSGIRGVVKQTHLFLAKTIAARGNLSLASRSLAPPGHSYHGVGDFDVGKVGFGARNFTADFAETDEFSRLVDLGYIDMRYPLHNLLGVRYEPWHIKVV
ncbi:MAG: M15 family metallopeptidase [Proteobacteria bacterium]|jgi:D-alanyl-D-alanine carboxypeptidase|nr:M15 family metallopeptidase [Pseudomonadota bacterium]